MHHVIRTIPSYFPVVSGPANQARAVAEGLRPWGFASRIVTTTLGAHNAPRVEQHGGVEVVRVPTQAGFMQYHVAAGAWHELRRPAALIHAHCYRNFLSDAAAVVARRRNIPLVLQLHGTLGGYRQIARRDHWWLYRAYDQLARPFGALRADQIVVATDEERREAEEYGLDPGRISVIPMGINPNDYYFFNERRDPQQIVFVGRLTDDRNPALLLRALACLRDLPWTCSLVGAEVRRSFANDRGYAEQLVRLADTLGIAHRVCFAGQLQGEQLRRAYAKAGVFVYPSRYENFGQTILEAAAAGCALLTTAVGVAHDLVREGVTGYRITADDVALLAVRLRALLEQPALQRSMGAAARLRVCRDYTWAPILSRYAALYEQLIDERTSNTTTLGLARTSRRNPV